MNKLVRAILLVLICTACASSKLIKKEGLSLVAISASSSGGAVAGVGILISLLHIESEQIYKSVPLSPVSVHSAVPNLPCGKYLVIELGLPIGGVTYYAGGERLVHYFDTLHIEANSKYYLGKFIGTKYFGRKNSVFLELEEADVPKNLKSILEGDRLRWTENDFKLIPPKSKDRFTVY
ncbi:MAG: hypothetical protein RLP15_12180 [Cryomorphaceae bacterium]